MCCASVAKLDTCDVLIFFFFSSSGRHTRCALVTGVQTCALPISRALDAGALLPEARWPQQIEVQAGKHFVRPRYEVIANGAMKPPRRRIAHANVERVDLKPDPPIPELSNLLGKGIILPAPTLPPPRLRPRALPPPAYRRKPWW